MRSFETVFAPCAFIALLLSLAWLAAYVRRFFRPQRGAFRRLPLGLVLPDWQRLDRRLCQRCRRRLALACAHTQLRISMFAVAVIVATPVVIACAGGIPNAGYEEIVVGLRALLVFAILLLSFMAGLEVWGVRYIASGLRRRCEPFGKPPHGPEVRYGKMGIPGWR